MRRFPDGSLPKMAVPLHLDGNHVVPGLEAVDIFRDGMPRVPGELSNLDLINRQELMRLQEWLEETQA